MSESLSDCCSFTHGVFMSSPGLYVNKKIIRCSCSNTGLIQYRVEQWLAAVCVISDTVWRVHSKRTSVLSRVCVKLLRNYV